MLNAMQALPRMRVRAASIIIARVLRLEFNRSRAEALAHALKHGHEGHVIELPSEIQRIVISRDILKD